MTSGAPGLPPRPLGAGLPVVGFLAAGALGAAWTEALYAGDGLFDALLSPEGAPWAAIGLSMLLGLAVGRRARSGAPDAGLWAGAGWVLGAGMVAAVHGDRWGIPASAAWSSAFARVVDPGAAALASSWGGPTLAASGATPAGGATARTPGAGALATGICAAILGAALVHAGLVVAGARYAVGGAAIGGAAAGGLDAVGDRRGGALLAAAAALAALAAAPDRPLLGGVAGGVAWGTAEIRRRRRSTPSPEPPVDR